ncbi:MAG: hypothetical protein WCA31_10110, partial [Acidimicrobiales bacterium]
YTVLHLSLVTVGACLVGPVNAHRLLLTLLAFFLAVGIGAHCLDELNGRPLKTSIPSWHLVVASALGIGGAVGIGVIGLIQVSLYLSLFMAVGVFIALAYNLELFHGRLHIPLVLVLGWGAFPVLTAYFAQHARLGVASCFAAAFGALVTQMQRLLSTPARDLRRRTASIDGTIVRSDGSAVEITREMMLRPLERALRALCWAGASLAVALAYVRLG